jgi:hypothetical protein
MFPSGAGIPLTSLTADLDNLYNLFKTFNCLFWAEVTTKSADKQALVAFVGTPSN